MAREVLTQLMFYGQAEEAMKFYVSLVPGSAIEHVEKYGPGEGGEAGSVKRAVFTLGGRRYACIDSPMRHAFTFTPSMSLFVECESEFELDLLASAFQEGGSALMPVGNYGFSKRFAWVQDRFGVSWQLNLQ